jgi:hypothetical protein
MVVWTVVVPNVETIPGSHTVSRGSYCVKGLMLYQGAHAVSTVSQLARGSDEYRNGLGIEGTLYLVSIRFR